MNKLNQMLINRFTIDKFTTKSCTLKSNSSFYQKFPKRENHFKNNNAFKYYLNNDHAQKNYVQSIQQLEKIKLNFDIATRTPIAHTIRPQTSKTRVKTETLSDLVTKNIDKRRPTTASTYKRSKAKR